jgi:hypothetical protein
MTVRLRSRTRTVILGLLVAGCGWAAPPAKLSGSIVGYVTNAAGSPQMGASVLLFNALDRLTLRTLTDEYGSFLFDSLAPGSYSVRVSLASFLPALKRNIIVQPGMRSLLSINLAAVLSSIELVYSAKGNNSVMSDDWKWVLRSGNATRPVLRFVPRVSIADPSAGSARAGGLFSQTHGLVKISGGDEGSVSQFGGETDLGTAFALATSVFGDNHIQVSGHFGYSASTGVPAAGLRTSFSRGSEQNPSSRVNLTLRELYLPARAGLGLLAGQEGAAPALRTMSVGFRDRRDLAEGLRLEYGFSLESVSFLTTLNYFSPYGRLTYDLGDRGVLEFAFNSGLPPAEFFASQKQPSGGLEQDLTALSLFPRVSLRGGRARVQRADNLELAYHTTIGSCTYGVAAYRESVTNAALTMVAPPGVLPPGDLLPDLLSNSAVFNAGDYSSAGYMASVTQALGDRLNLTLAGGSGNALIPERSELPAGSADEVRQILRHGQRRWLSLGLSARLPLTGAEAAASYRWAGGRSLTAPHVYLTQPLRADIGWNVHFRQPVPVMSGMRGRLEITADLRNLLAQGYLPMSTPQGRRVLLLHSPRSLRGGFNFIF